MPVIYADVVWSVNFVMDSILVMATCWVLKIPVRVWRVLLAGIAGACYSLFLFVPSFALLTTWPGKFAASVAVVVIGVPTKTWAQLLRACVVYYVVAFVLAGAAIALHFAVPGMTVAKGVVVAGRGVEFAVNIGILALIASVPVGYAAVRYAVRRLREREFADAVMWRVHVTIGGKTASFVGLVDTGNQLREPVSRRPVCLVDATVLGPLLPAPLERALESGGDWLAVLEDLADMGHGLRFAVIPFRGAGSTQQLALGVLPDALALERAGVRREIHEPCWLAVHPEPLSVEGRFQAILHFELLTGVDGCEKEVTARQTHHEDAHSPAVAVDSHSNTPHGWA